MKLHSSGKSITGCRAWIAKTATVAGVILSVGVWGRASSHLNTPLAPEEVIRRMELRFQEQLDALAAYRDVRRYSVAHALLGDGTFYVVQEQYAAPGEKQFEVLERGGSGSVQRRVFARLLEVEQETARDEIRLQVDLSSKNYEFTYVDFDEQANAYRFQAQPRGKNDYLLRGIIWVNAEDFGVQRIEGEPAKRHSFLIKRVRFIHEFAKFGEFWFPVHHRSETKLRLFGTATLEIEYSDYEWEEKDAAISRLQSTPHAAETAFYMASEEELR